MRARKASAIVMIPKADTEGQPQNAAFKQMAEDGGDRDNHQNGQDPCQPARGEAQRLAVERVIEHSDQPAHPGYGVPDCTHQPIGITECGLNNEGKEGERDSHDPQSR